MPGAPSRIRLCNVEDVGEGEARKVEAGGLTVVMDACIGTMHAILQVPKK